MTRQRQAFVFVASLGMTIMTGPAWGQPATQANDRPITITVMQSELSLIGRGLGLLPFGEVAPLMAKLQQQVQGQLGGAQAPIEAPK